MLLLPVYVVWPRCNTSHQEDQADESRMHFLVHLEGKESQMY